ncbi:metallophosphoesterase [Asanoa ishikariensis]|uniref:metallophosphoesterase n=1 Tax=Asanoa ishikariensis TaxID=137265 RepID=UPI001EF383C5|nr:metallophosphoesterase [Asanoa ishikariensis]
MTEAEIVPEPPAQQPRRLRRTVLTLATMVLILFGVPCGLLVFAGQDWPAWARGLGSAVFFFGALLYGRMMVLGHGRRHRDWAARIGDTTLGVIWVLFTCSILAQLVRLPLWAGGVDDPLRSRITAGAALFAALVLLGWGHYEAMRVSRVREVEVTIPRLGIGLDGLRVVLLTDTHYGPINRARWSAGVVDVVNALDADLVCHTGDIADGTVTQRLEQAAPLGQVKARYGRAYVTGNHEYFSEAQEWLDHMRELGWDSLHNRHIVLTRDGSSLVVAGVDDRTAALSGKPGHRTDHAAALAGADPDLPVLLLAHQPRQIDGAVEHGIDLQISGHTHGGQIWPFHYLVLTDQPVLHGLSRHGERTQLYTSRGTGFWGPPFRVFAPSEITLITLRAAAQR